MEAPLVGTLLGRLQASYERGRDVPKARPMVAYMRSQFPFLGIPSGERTALDRDIVAGLEPPRERDLIELALACWDLREREYQYFAVGYLRRWVSRLPASAEFLPTVEQLITTKSWWDTVDELAQHVAGPLVAAHPALTVAMDRWIGSDALWLARTAIIYQQRYKTATDVDRLFRYCLLRAGDTDFFIRKAIGWALREYSKTDAGAVRRFVADHQGELSPLSQREALKWLDRRPAAG